MPLGFSHRRKLSKPFIEETRIGSILVGSTEVELKVGEEPLANRNSVIIINDSSALVFVNDTNPFDISSAFTLFSGEVLKLSVDPSRINANTIRLFAKTDEIDTIIKLMEVK